MRTNYGTPPAMQDVVPYRYDRYKNCKKATLLIFGTVISLLLISLPVDYMTSEKKSEFNVTDVTTNSTFCDVKFPSNIKSQWNESYVIVPCQTIDKGTFNMCFYFNYYYKNNIKILCVSKIYKFRINSYNNGENILLVSVIAVSLFWIVTMVLWYIKIPKFRLTYQHF